MWQRVSAGELLGRESRDEPYPGQGMQWEEEGGRNLRRKRNKNTLVTRQISPITLTYRSQQRQAGILQMSSAGAAAHQAGRSRQAVEGSAGRTADPGKGEGQDRVHYLRGWS